MPKSVLEGAEKETKRLYSHFNAKLTDKTFLYDDQLSMVDFMLVQTIIQAKMLEINFAEEYPNLAKYLHVMTETVPVLKKDM